MTREGQIKRVINHGHVDQTLIEDHHEALVSRELYDVVQELLDRVVLGAHRTRFSEAEQALMNRAMKLAAKEAQSWQKSA